MKAALLSRFFYKSPKRVLEFIMLDWKLIGDIFLCLAILGSGVLVTYANANYIPEKDEGSDDEER